MYGTVNQNEILLTRKNARAINIAVTIKAANITSATSGNSEPKNANDHNALNTMLIANNIYAFVLSYLLPVLFFCITKNNAKPIKKYNIVHANGKTHAAGVNKDTSNELYHKFSPLLIGVTKAPKIPGKKDKNIAKTNLRKTIIISFCKFYKNYTIIKK